MGFVLLAGGGEFTGGMRAADERALALAGGSPAPVRIVPAAAEANHLIAGENGVRWFKRLGAQDVRALGVVDPATAGRPDLCAELQAARLIFLAGGSPGHLAETLGGSRAWRAVVAAYSRGAVLAGSSAGAMVLCARYFDPAAGIIRRGLSLVEGAGIIPHHARFGADWAPRLCEALPGVLLIGIDEETGILNDGPGGAWTVYGPGEVTVYGSGGRRVFCSGSRLELPGVAIRSAAPG